MSVYIYMREYMSVCMYEGAYKCVCMRECTSVCLYEGVYECVLV